MKLLFTGATGYTGKGMATVLAAHHFVRGVDINAGTGACQEMVVADITDLAACQRITEGIDAIVMCHMAPNPIGYKTPPPAFDINVKGTANLYHAAVERGIRRVVLLSSAGVIARKPVMERNAIPGVGPYDYCSGLYSVTKAFQEGVARHYFETNNIATAILRPSWIVNEGDLITKYGEKMVNFYPSLIDPRDIGDAAVKALALDDLAIETFILGQDGFETTYDMTSTRTRLRWSAAHRFETLVRTPAGM